MVPLMPLSFNAGGGLSPWAFAIDKRNMIAISILEVGANDQEHELAISSTFKYDNCASILLAKSKMSKTKY